MGDRELLREYAQTGSHVAFAELVTRHLDWVYGVCRRRVSDASLADDVTQAVFIVLAKKASTLSPDIVLAGWLMKTIHFAATDALKRQSRRRHYERKAAEMNQSALPHADQPELEELLPLVDEAVTRLPAGYRDAVALRFYRQQSYAEIATALGLSEAAAKKRVLRGLEKLRSLLGSRASAFSVAALTAAGATLAPTTLHAAVLASASSGNTTAALAIAQGAIQLMTWAKAKLAVVLVVAGLGIAGTTGLVFQRVAADSIEAAPQATSAASFTPESTAPKSAAPIAAARILPELSGELLRFTDAGGAFEQFHLAIPIQALPQRSLTTAEVLIERDGERSTLLIRSARESLPYAYVVDGFLCQLDAANPGGVVVALGLAPQVVLRASEAGNQAMTEVAVGAAAIKKVDVDLGSLIERLQREATGSSHDELQNTYRFCNADMGGRIVLAADALSDEPPVADYGVTERVRLAVRVREIRVGPPSLMLPRLTLDRIERLGISIRRVRPADVAGDLLPPAGFFDDRIQTVTARKLNSLLQRREPRLASAQPPAIIE